MGDYVCSDKGGLKEIRFDKGISFRRSKEKEKIKEKDKKIKYPVDSKSRK